MATAVSQLESRERVCPECGKTFIMAPYHTYKITTRGYTEYYCRYNCYRKVQKEQEVKKGGNKRGEKVLY